MEKTFAQAKEMARSIHNFKKKHFILDTTKGKLRLIHMALLSSEIGEFCPIAHHILDIKDADGHGNSSLNSASGWSIKMNFWWWTECDQN